MSAWFKNSLPIYPPCYTIGGVSSTERKVEEEQCSEMMLPQLHLDDSISNPLYETYKGQGSNIATQSNPSYDVNKPNTEIDENQYDYVQSTEFTRSYGMTARMGNNTKTTSGSDVTIIPNPAYVKANK